MDEKPKKNKDIEEVQKPRGFDRGLEADKIIGATDCNGELLYLITWKGTDEADLLPSVVINKHCPEVVISFYEKRNKPIFKRRSLSSLPSSIASSDTPIAPKSEIEIVE